MCLPLQLDAGAVVLRLVLDVRHFSGSLFSCLRDRRKGFSNDLKRAVVGAVLQSELVAKLRSGDSRIRPLELLALLAFHEFSVEGVTNRLMEIKIDGEGYFLDAVAWIRGTVKKPADG